MTCSYCGTELPPGAMFCGECGRAVSSKAQRAATQATADAAALLTAGPASVAEAAPAELDQVAVIDPPKPKSQVKPKPRPEPKAEPKQQAKAQPKITAQPKAKAQPKAESHAKPAPVALVAPPSAVPLVPPAVAAPPVAPEIAPAPVPVAPEVIEDLAQERAETCAQCGARLEASDIFCPECGFVRQSVAARGRPNDTAVLDPFPWGLPPSTESRATAVVVAPAVGRVAGADPDVDVDVDETRIVDRTTGSGARYVLQFSTGESVSVSGAGLVGRNPIAEPGEYFDSIVTIADPGRSVSKTHLEFGQDAGAFWISDRFSGNGTVLREPDREPRRCDAGKRYRVTRGARIDIGEQFFIVS